MQVTALTSIGQIAKSAVVQNIRVLTTKVSSKNRTVELTNEHEWKLYGFNTIEYTETNTTASRQPMDSLTDILDFNILQELYQTSEEVLEGQPDRLTQTIPQFGQTNFYVSSNNIILW